jgi:hypothetical protein
MDYFGVVLGTYHVALSYESNSATNYAILVALIVTAFASGTGIIAVYVMSMFCGMLAVYSLIPIGLILLALPKIAPWIIIGVAIIFILVLLASFILAAGSELEVGMRWISLILTLEGLAIYCGITYSAPCSVIAAALVLGLIGGCNFKNPALFWA